MTGRPGGPLRAGLPAAFLVCLLLLPDWPIRSTARSAAPSAAARPAAATVDVAIVLAVDCSWSVDAREYDQQIQGLAAAFRSRDVIDAIAGGPNGRIAVTIIQWAAPDQQHLAIPWTIIASPQDALLLSARIGVTPRGIADGATSITAVISTGIGLHRSRPFTALRQVIDISSDGINNTGGRPEPVRDNAAGQGIIVNGLTILNEVPYLHHYFRDHVIAGPGAFVETAGDYADYRNAIKRKLLREIGLPLS